MNASGTVKLLSVHLYQHVYTAIHKWFSWTTGTAGSRHVMLIFK